ESCQKNKANRSNVKYSHATGSCSYEVLVENLGDKYLDEEPDALDLFKETHYSKRKKGYTPAVESVITEMENQLATPREGEEQPNSVTEIVGAVLEKNTKKNHFLQNVGINVARARSNVQNVQVELQAEKRANAELRDQVDVLS
ncbi:unnamed protein product, partial [Urochloa humidicola]